MDLSQQDARESLSQIQDTVERTRKMVAYAGGDTVFTVWGVVWVLGYLGTHFLPHVCHWIWLVLVATGVLLTFVVMRRHTAVRSAAGKRIALFWFLLFIYVDLWLALLFPFIRVQGAEQSAMFWRHLGAISATVPMFAYVAVGLWLEHFMIWIGLAVTALTILGLFLIPPYFFIWMAAAGGGTLIGTGLLIRNRWR